jgi:hypothetical protein
MRTARHFVLSVVAAAALTATPARAADPDLDRFKGQIDAVIAGFRPGVVDWAAPPAWDMQRDGDSLVAAISDGKLLIHTEPQLRIGFDRLEIRETPARGGGDSLALAMLLPKAVTLTGADGEEVKIGLDEGRVNMVLDAASGRAREANASLAALRLEHSESGGRLSLGPVTMNSKLVAEPDGGWSAPSALELKKVEFAFPSAPLAGSVEQISLTGKSAGPKLAALEQFRDSVDALRKDKQIAPEARMARIMALLPGLPSVFSAIEGKVVIEGVKARGEGDQTMVSLAKVELGAAASGFDRDAAAIRLTVREDGLDLAPPLLDPRLVPRRIVIDLGVENLQMAVLRTLLQAASHSAGDKAAREQAPQQAFGALANLNPTLRIHDIAIDTADVGAELTGEAKGSPLLPTGYTAKGDFVVRGFDALPGLLGPTPFGEYLPLLRELAVSEKPADGAPRAVFHLASSPEKWATVNGNDVSGWFASNEPGEPRLIRPAEPPMEGVDVKNLQRALASAKLPVAQDGVYRAATAAAVARFQKQQGLNVSGVVDAATRQALGLKAAPRPGGRN